MHSFLSVKPNHSPGTHQPTQKEFLLLKVIGAGFGRTGTHSLGAALEVLGYGPCYHMHELARHPEHIPFWVDALQGKSVDWRGFFSLYSSTVEWPAASFLPQLLQAFPDARVILTLRDAEAWFESANATIFEGLELSAFNPDPAKHEQGDLARRLILDGVFSGRQREKEFALQVYRRHIARVSRAGPCRAAADYQVADGWRPLCRFLGAPEPEKAFPRLNERAEFLSTEPEWAREIKRKRANDVRKG